MRLVGWCVWLHTFRGYYYVWYTITWLCVVGDVGYVGWCGLCVLIYL